MAFDGVLIGLSDGLAEHEGLFVVLAHVSGRPGHWPDRCGLAIRLQAGSLSIPLLYGPPASGVIHKYPNNQSLVPIQGLDSTDPDSIGLLLLPQPWRGGGGCEGTSPPGIGTRMRSRSPEEEGAGPGALPVAGRGQRGRSATRSKGEPAYPVSYTGAGEGLRPFEPRLAGSPPFLSADAPSEGVATGPEVIGGKAFSLPLFAGSGSHITYL